jgi:hypothetical protein
MGFNVLNAHSGAKQGWLFGLFIGLGIEVPAPSPFFVAAGITYHNAINKFQRITSGWVDLDTLAFGVNVGLRL